MADPEKKLYTVHNRQQFGGVQYGEGNYLLEPHQAAGLGATLVEAKDAKKANAGNAANAPTEPKPFTEGEIEKIKALRGELPADFPAKAAFNKAGIKNVEQITGTAEDELLKINGITKPTLVQVQERLRAMAAELAK